MKGKGKRMLIAFAMTALIFAGSATAYAWFTYQLRLTTITKINAPTALIIGAGQKESSQNIDIGEINVEDEAGKKDFVFSVYSDESVSNYKLQIAHTTNIDFTYTVFPAQEQQGSGDVEYVDEDGIAHYYSKSGSAASGKYLNLGSDEKKADDSLHKESYDSYKNVQENAEPLYWQSNEIQPENNSGQGFVDYYILEISWNDDVRNDKETDMVYLTAGIV